MWISDCTVREARRVVKAWHRHLPNLQGGLFAAKLVDDSGVIGCAVAGNPARVWQGTGRVVFTRCAVSDGHKNACSMLYGALARAARSLGYREAWTYTLPEEPGTSLIAGGWEDMGITDGGEHDRPSRPRKKAARNDPKRRWRLVLAHDCAWPSCGRRARHHFRGGWFCREHRWTGDEQALAFIGGA